MWPWPGGSGGSPAPTCTTSARCGSRGDQTLLALDLRDRRSGYPLETVLAAAAAGWRIQAADVWYQPRTGKSKVTGTVRGTVNAVRDMAAILTSDLSR